LVLTPTNVDVNPSGTTAANKLNMEYTIGNVADTYPLEFNVAKFGNWEANAETHYQIQYASFSYFSDSTGYINFTTYL